MKKSFKNWLEWADYGFDRQAPEEKEQDDDLPYDPINSEIIIKELLSLGKVGTKPPKHAWHTCLEYGEKTQPGAMEIDISPLGSYKIVTRKKIRTLEGEIVGICKHVLSLNEHDTKNSNEIPIAHKMYSVLEIIDGVMLDAAKPEYPEFKKLVVYLATAAARLAPKIMMYKGVKELDENYALIWFELNGAGIEAPGHERVEQFNIRIQFDKKTGLIRCWGHDVTSPMRQHKWEAQPSEWDEYFAPTQTMKEITEAIIGAFRTY